MTAPLPEDGIYVLLKEVLDNCIDEHVMGFGKEIEITIEENIVTVRDYGRGIPLGKLHGMRQPRSTPAPSTTARPSSAASASTASASRR